MSGRLEGSTAKGCGSCDSGSNIKNGVTPIKTRLLRKGQSSDSDTINTKKNSPPSPSKLPIIGNLHQLGLQPHRSLQTLARRHGLLMLLHFRSVPVLVVSSADAAEEIMKTQDLKFVNWPKPSMFGKLMYNYKDVAMAPYGEYQRQMKSTLVLHLLSNKRVQSFHYVREEETSLMIEKFKQCYDSSSSVNLSEVFAKLTNDVICRVALGKKYGEGEGGREFKELLEELDELLGAISVGDYIPWLSWENVIGFPIDGVGIKGVILDAFVAGTDTTYTVLDWAMTELLRHPVMMKDVQNEVREIIGNKKDITEYDLDKMHYLMAILNETLRFHPSVPLLIPRKSIQDAKIHGYDIAADTQIIINAWAIGRDPMLWDKPEEFQPERFSTSPIDFKGHDFQLIPFGAGRRGCPGISFSIMTIELALANLVHNFDWTLPGQARGEDLDMTESTGLTIHKKFPLMAIATPYSG
ncbi:hypothetical protein ACB098_04G141100 [Castanea mollissima]